MKKYLATFCFITISFFTFAQNITQAEYFLDEDAGFGKNTLVNVTPSTDAGFPITVNVNGATAGFHKLYIRTKDSDGNWSHTSRRTVEILKSEAKQVIVGGEYFFDEDPGFGAGTAIKVSPQDSVIMQNFNAVVTGLAPGFHKIYLRMKDNYGNWGITVRQNMEIIKSDSSYITVAEYFFDTDPGFGNCASATFAIPAQDSTFTFTIPASQIPADYDNFYLRVKDSSNYNWSLTNWIGRTTLPLTFLDFTVIKQNNTAQLNWETTNEVNTAYFNIQRSTDAISFNTVGKVTAKGVSSVNNNYNYADDLIHVRGGKIFYRLEQADKDGKISYSKVVSIVVESNNKYVITPNPAKNFFTVSGNGNVQTGSATLLVRDLAGHTILQQRLSNTSSQTINISGLTKGMYIVRIIASGTVQTQKLLVQ